MKMFGKEYTKSEILAYCDLKPVTEYADEIVVTTGNLSFMVLKNRGLDIADTSYRGMPVSYNSKVRGQEGETFLARFFGGMLTTCGPLNVGSPCEVDGMQHPQHGTLNNTKAYDICVSTDWVGDELVTVIKGKLKTAAVFGTNLILHRTITSVYGKDTIQVDDVLENRSFEEVGYMMLYHMNFGFPFLDETAVLSTNATDVMDLTGYSDTTAFTRFCKPIAGFKEECFRHTAVKDTYAVLENRGVRATLTFENLPYLVEWKQMGAGDYVLGLEPATNEPKGRAAAIKDGDLLTLAPLTSTEFSVKLTFEDIK